MTLKTIVLKKTLTLFNFAFLFLFCLFVTQSRQLQVTYDIIGVEGGCKCTKSNVFIKNSLRIY